MGLAMARTAQPNNIQRAAVINMVPLNSLRTPTVPAGFGPDYPAITDSIAKGVVCPDMLWRATEPKRVVLLFPLFVGLVSAPVVLTYTINVLCSMLHNIFSRTQYALV
jgi:hypothetical protein